MILSFSDVHLGIKTYSIQNDVGLATAEVEARIALDAVYTRASQPDIDLITFTGDMFHTSHPTTENIKYFIGWIQRMNSLGKPLIMIPGNHDVSVYSNSMIFTHEQDLKYVHFIDQEDSTRPFNKSYYRWATGGEDMWDIYALPYLSFDTTKDKNGPTFDLVKNVLSECGDKTIIMAHVYDTDVTVGSESMMISRFTETIDFGEFDQKDVIMILGHAHKHQHYVKKNGIRVIFPGSLFFHELTDVDQEKGYVLISDTGECQFEAIKGIREFVSFKIPDNEKAVDFFSSFRLSSNKFIFATASDEQTIDEVELREFLESKGCGFDRVRYKKAEEIKDNAVDVDLVGMNPLSQFRDYIDKTNPDLIEEVKSMGCTYLEKAGGIQG